MATCAIRRWRMAENQDTTARHPHGSQFKDAALIVASPPCQEYSYMAMPWSKAKAKAKAIREDDTGQKLADLNRLFHACFRIQREASFAAGHLVPASWSRTSRVRSRGLVAQDGISVHFIYGATWA